MPRNRRHELNFEVTEEHLDLVQAGQGHVDGGSFRSTIGPPPFVPKVFLTGSLISAMASSAGMTLASLKKQVCITVLMRTPSSASWATL